MEEFEASEIVTRVVEGEVPNLKHSCIPSTYKGVGQQVKIKMVASVVWREWWCSLLFNICDHTEQGAGVSRNSWEYRPHIPVPKVWE